MPWPTSPNGQASASFLADADKAETCQPKLTLDTGTEVTYWEALAAALRQGRRLREAAGPQCPPSYRSLRESWPASFASSG